MVDLPATSNVVPMVKAPQSRVSPGEIAQPYQELGANLDKAGDLLMKDVAEPLAQKAGLRAVSRNPETGELQVADAPLIVGDAATAFHRAAKYSALAQGEAEAKRQDLVLSKQFHNDPEGYVQAANAFRDEHVKNYSKMLGDDVGIALGRSIDNATTYNYRWLLLEQQRNIKHDFDKSTRAKLTDLDQDIKSLIESGDTSSPTLQGKINERIHITNERVNNPILAAPKGEAEVELKQFDQQVGSARFVAKVNDTIQNGGIDKANRLIEAAGNDPALSPVQRALNVAHGQAAISNYMANLQKQAHLNTTFQKQNDDLIENAIIKDRASDNPTITENDIKTNPSLSSSAKMRMLNWIKREDMPEPLARTSEVATQDAMRRMALPADDPNAITSLGQIRELYANKGVLKRADEEWLEKRFTEGRTPDGQQLNKQREALFKAAALDKSTLMAHDQTGKMQNYQFEFYVDQRIAQYRAEKKNPFDLFDPSKPDFLGKPAILDYFKSTMQESINNKTNDISRKRPAPPPGMVLPQDAPAATPRQPGETMAEFDKRMGLR